MKKKYLIPVTEVIMIQTSCMIANSPMNFNPNNESGEGDLIDGDATGAGLSRQGFGLWGEGEE